MKNALLLSDLHFTSNPRDEYRWGILDWVRKEVTYKGLENVYILGDLTDAKDYHSSLLVNRLVNRLSAIAKRCPVTILRGNHDGIDERTPYFKFLNEVEFVRFIIKPQVDRSTVFLPHSRDPDNDWTGLVDDIKNAETVFVHATIANAVSENGRPLQGVPSSWFAKAKGKVWGGDVHVPQTVGKVEYVGSPYHVRFGDSFKGRCVLLDNNGQAHDLHYPCLSRHLIELNLGPDGGFKFPKKVLAGDQAKIRASLPRSQYGRWSQIRGRIVALFEQNGVDVVSIELLQAKEERGLETVGPNEKIIRQTPEQLFNEYCKQQRIDPEIKEIGERIMGEEGKG